MQPCNTWQPLYQPGSKQLQVWLYRRPLLLLRPLSLKFRLVRPFLCPRFKHWDWTLAVTSTLSCKRLCQRGWALETQLPTIPCFRCPHIAKLPWQLSKEPCEEGHNKSGTRTCTYIRIHCIQHWVWFQLSLGLPDNRRWRRISLDEQDLWLRPAEQDHQREQSRRHIVHN